MKIHAPLTACIVLQQLLVLVGLDTRPAPHWVLPKAPHLLMYCIGDKTEERSLMKVMLITGSHLRHHTREVLRREGLSTLRPLRFQRKQMNQQSVFQQQLLLQ
jgi:hypothetical protein